MRVGRYTVLDTPHLTGGLCTLGCTQFVHDRVIIRMHRQLFQFVVIHNHTVVGCLDTHPFGVPFICAFQERVDIHTGQSSPQGIHTSFNRFAHTRDGFWTFPMLCLECCDCLYQSTCAGEEVSDLRRIDVVKGSTTFAVVLHGDPTDPLGLCVDFNIIHSTGSTLVEKR